MRWLAIVFVGLVVGWNLRLLWKDLGDFIRAIRGIGRDPEDGPWRD